MYQIKPNSIHINPITILIFLLAAASCADSIPDGNMASSIKATGESKPKVNATNSPTRYAEINGRKIAYRAIGNGQPMILCLRYRGNMDSWDPAFLDALSINYNVIVFDYSGFGLSTGTPPSSMLGFANDVKDLATFLKLEKFIVGGWSFGGAVAQIVTTEMPELVSHTVLIGTRPPGKFGHLPEKIFLEISAKAQNDLNDEVILFSEPASEISKAAAKRSHDRIAARTVDKDVYISQDLWPQYVKAFSDFEKDPYNAREKLATTTIPVLVISADHEVVFPPQNWFEVNRKFRTTQLVVIPQAGHGPQQQYPEMVAEYIRSFIETTSSNS